MNLTNLKNSENRASSKNSIKFKKKLNTQEFERRYSGRRPVFGGQ